MVWQDWKCQCFDASVIKSISGAFAVWNLSSGTWKYQTKIDKSPKIKWMKNLNVVFWLCVGF